MPVDPVLPGYFADPFVTSTEDGWVAYGTSDPVVRDGLAFRVRRSSDLVEWHDVEPVLRVDLAIGTDYWAPEVVRDERGWWMLFSAGHGIAGHRIRVARSDSAFGPFEDTGVDLSPEETFAIDPHPFTDADGSRWLFFARDVPDAEQRGTHLAVRPMADWTRPAGPASEVLAPNALWQRYEADRDMYGRRADWYTLEGPNVVRRGDEYVLLYSGGSWEGPDYGVAHATAPSPDGPWRHEATQRPTVLSHALTGLSGPGHDSLVPLPGGGSAIAFHAWDDAGAVRRMHLATVRWQRTTPTVDLDAPPRPAAARTSPPGTRTASTTRRRE